MLAIHCVIPAWKAGSSLALDNLSLGYALTYLIGLVSLIVGARYLPKLQHQDLQTSAQQIARERGLTLMPTVRFIYR